MHGFFQKLLSWVHPAGWLRNAAGGEGQGGGVGKCALRPGFVVNVKFENDDEKICRDA
jgi:hypothetical protein